MQERNSAQERFLEQTIEQVQASHGKKESVQKQPQIATSEPVNGGAGQSAELTEAQQTAIQVHTFTSRCLDVGMLHAHFASSSSSQHLSNAALLLLCIVISGKLT